MSHSLLPGTHALPILDAAQSAPPGEPALASDEVHVWCAWLDQPQPVVRRLARLLSAEERARADRYYFARHRFRFIVGRGVLRQVLGHYLRLAPQELQFHYGPHGKPALTESFGGRALKFNLSHSDSLALYAIAADRELGVDVEQVREIAEVDQIAMRLFTPSEQTCLWVLPEAERREAFLKYWTRKEAYLKATGAGLAQPLNQIDVSASQEEPWWALTVAEDPHEGCRWTCADLRPVHGYVAAIVAQGRAPHIHCWRYVLSEGIDVPDIP